MLLPYSASMAVAAATSAENPAAQFVQKQTPRAAYSAYAKSARQQRWRERAANAVCAVVRVSAEAAAWRGVHVVRGARSAFKRAAALLRVGARECVAHAHRQPAMQRVQRYVTSHTKCHYACHGYLIAAGRPPRLFLPPPRAFVMPLMDLPLL